MTSVVVPQDRGAVTWNAITSTKHDSEVYSAGSGCVIGVSASCSVAHTGMGSPIPGEVDHYSKTGYLPSSYHGYEVTVQISANLMGMSWPTPVPLSLPPPL